MNLHSILVIDKSFRLCYLKKKRFFIKERFFMDKLIVLLLLCMISVAGCRNSKRDELPEVKPLPGDENVRVTLNVNITDTPDAVPADKVAAPAAKTEQKSRKVRKKSSGSNQIILSPKAKKNLQKKQSQRRRKELVPSGVGIIDSELNSVEQSYLREIRSRREQQVRNSEQQVFGSFSPGNIFKAPQD